MTESVAEPIGGRLTLRRTRFGDYVPADDYEVMSDGRAIGRIYRPHAGAPRDLPWEWTITGAVVAPAFRNQGFEPTFEEAKTAFATTWRAWLGHNSNGGP